MTSNSYFQILFYVVTLIALAKPLGWYMAKVYEGESVGLNGIFSSIENSTACSFSRLVGLFLSFDCKTH